MRIYLVCWCSLSRIII